MAEQNKHQEPGPTRPPSGESTDSAEEVFTALGIEHLIPNIKDILKIRRLSLLRFITREEFDEVLNTVEAPAEKRALLKAFEIVSSSKQFKLNNGDNNESEKDVLDSSWEMLRVDDDEKDMRNSITQAGLDDKIWVPKIQEWFKLQSMGQLKSVNNEQIEAFLESLEPAVQSVLRQIFTEMSGVDTITNHWQGESSPTAAQVVRSVQEGVLCQGVCFSEDVEKMVQERETVIDINDALKFKPTRSTHEILHNEFTSKEAMEIFVNNIDKHMNARSVSVGVNVWGVSLEAERGETKQEEKSKNFMSSVHYQRIPVATVDLTPSEINLRSEVISALQHAEASLKKDDYKPGRHFKNFFEMCGTHVNTGTVELGGILVSVAWTEGFPEEERAKRTSAVTKVSESALVNGFSKKISPGVIYKADEVLNKTPSISVEDLESVNVTLSMIGGPPGVVEKDQWKKELSENCDFWVVINRGSPPKPLWKMLLKHIHDFEDCVRLASVMQEEWKTFKLREPQDDEVEEMEVEEHHVPKEAVTQIDDDSLEDDTEVKQYNALRRDIQMWVDRFRILNQHSVEQAIKNLAGLRQKYDKISGDWQDEVIQLRDIQTQLLWTAKYMRTATDRNQILQLASALKHILNPMDKIRTSSFPGIRLVVQSIKEAEGTKEENPVVMENIRELPKILSEKARLIKRQEDKDNELRHFQESLEAAMKIICSKANNSYDELMCFGVLQLFGFSTAECQFINELEARDINNMSQALKDNFQKLDAASNDDIKQAFILRLALYCIRQRQLTVQHMIEKMPGGVCEVLKEACQRSPENVIHLEVLQFSVENILDANGIQHDLKPLIYSLQNQLKFLKPRESIQREEKTVQNDVLDEGVQKLLEILDMKKYYPQKLTYEEVITLGPDAQDGINKNPTTLPELPWYFMRNIIGLDSNTRENCHVFPEGDGSDEEDEEGSDESFEDNGVHPLDLICIIFLCADDFLRQELVDKMAKCQYAVPFVLPSPSSQNGQKSSERLIIHWGLKGMARTFSNNGCIVNKTLVDAEAPLVACVNLGDEDSWKPKLLNRMLSPQQETFWHQGLKGGNCTQRTSEGMAEVAWYLPGGHEDDKFPYPVTFVNVRQNAMRCAALCDRLHSSSTVTCVFVEEVTAEVKAFLKRKRPLEKILLVVLHSKEQEKRVASQCKQLQQEFNLERHQIIRKAARDTNFNTVYEQLKRAVEKMITSVTHAGSLSTFVCHAKEMGMKVDDDKCYKGHMAAESILRDIDEFNMASPATAKGAVLPCQSDVSSRKEMAALEKELCRQKKLDEDTTVQRYGAQILDKKWKLHQQQTQTPVSRSFEYFLQCLLNLHDDDRRYFLQCLKLGLNERSIEQLRPLYDEYEKCRIEDESPERNERLRKIDEQLTYGSLGIEHFFREMAILYENIAALRDRTNSKSLNGCLAILSAIMADLLMKGTAVEIMDGDAVNVPVVWLSDVLNTIEGSCKLSLFKVSVLGAQSCGKSTLLNTIFGLNFPVSSGRCTRGAYMQLVKVDEKLQKQLHCNYVAVIDSEGLMSRTKVDGTDYDNELSTFIIGLSDLTLVIIKGEGNEMHDVLPLAIHVFLRMNIVGEHQACHFVHQNMGAVDAISKVATEIDAFVRDLNIKTLAAAKDVDQSDQYTKFSDVLQYDPSTDNTYVPGLWDGTLPMGKTNVHYSKRMGKLKAAILNSILQMQTKQNKRLSKFTDFSRRLDELWEAIKYENFVLSFKNVLAVEAHRKLSKIYDEEQWNLKREVREMIQQEQNIIGNEIKGGRSEKSPKHLIEASVGKLSDHLSARIVEIEANIMHYFQCSGCKECNADVANRHLLANNEKEFQDEIRYFKTKMQREIEDVMEHLEIKMKTDERIHELSSEMDGTLKHKVQEVIQERKDEAFTEKAMEELFEEFWKETAGDIQRRARRVVNEENIEAMVQVTVRSLLERDSHVYMQKVQTNKGSERRGENTIQSAKSKFIVDLKCHIRLSGFWAKNFRNPSEQDGIRLLTEADRIINETSKYYNSTFAPAEGKQFNQKDAELLFKEALQQINAVRDDRFKTTREFKVDLLHFIEILAVQGFTAMHEKYRKKCSPEALLEEKKKSYREFFLIKMGQGDAAVSFCNTILQDLVLMNIEEQLSCTELLHDLRVHCGEMFRDVKSIQASVMINLLREKKFMLFREYITGYRYHVKGAMDMESKRYFIKNDRFKQLAKIKLDSIIKTIEDAIDKTVGNLADGERFMETFLSNLETLKISRNEVSAYLDLDVPNIKDFADILHQWLQGRLRDDIITEISSWDIYSKLDEKKTADFFFNEVVGCSARCPFCKVPCDNHSGGKTLGNHSATLHRPQGLGGWRYLTTEVLVSSDCCFDVAPSSNATFQCVETNYETKPCKEYQKWFPSWTIHGSANPNVEKYWKWVLAKYNEEFARYYSAKKAEVPKNWIKYTEEAIIEEIQDNYHIQIETLNKTE